MTEREYIMATDVRAIEIAREALRHILPANNPNVPADEHATVLRLLQKWEVGTRREIQTR